MFYTVHKHTAQTLLRAIAHGIEYALCGKLN